MEHAKCRPSSFLWNGEMVFGLLLKTYQTPQNYIQMLLCVETWAIDDLLLCECVCVCVCPHTIHVSRHPLSFHILDA